MASIGSPSIELSRTLQKQLIEDIDNHGGPESRKLYHYFDRKQDVYGAKGSHKRKQVENFLYRYRSNTNSNLLESPNLATIQPQQYSSPSFVKSSGTMSDNAGTSALEAFAPEGYDGYYGTY